MMTMRTLRYPGSLVVCLLVAACGGGSESGSGSGSGSYGGTGGSTMGAGGAPSASPTAVVVRTATLDSAQQIPPPAVASTGTGKGAVLVDATTREIRGGITLAGLAGAATAVQVRRAVPGAAGAFAEIDLIRVGDGAIVPPGTILTAAQYDALLAGELYFHVETTANSDGELRGQLMGQGGSIAATATLAGDQEFPPVSTLASGAGALVVDSASKAIVVASETIGGMTPTATHLHEGATGTNGNVVVGLDLAPGAAIDTYLATAPHGAAPLSDAQYAALVAGGLYYNAHSLGYPDGEIRGQLEVRPQAAAGIVPTLASIQANVFTPRCAVSGCHGSSGTQVNLTLVAGSSYANLVGVASFQNPSLTRVIAGNPNDSLIIRKLEQATPPVGVRMPFGGPYLSQGTINVIRQWIQLGAPAT